MPRTNEPPRRQPSLHSAAAVIEARVAARLSRKDLADITGISLTHICEMEKDRRSCSTEYLNRIADACGRPVSQLLNPNLGRVA
jgi:transcriptional regulator with XRE-family HTH domain